MIRFSTKLFLKKPHTMKTRFMIRRLRHCACLISTSVLIASVFFSGAVPVSAQQRLSKRYPVGKNIRIELKNISGTITVESWNRDEIRLTATMESPTAHIVPKQLDECLVVDVMATIAAAAMWEMSISNFRCQLTVQSIWKHVVVRSTSPIFVVLRSAPMFRLKETLNSPMSPLLR